MFLLTGQYDDITGRIVGPETNRGLPVNCCYLHTTLQLSIAESKRRYSFYRPIEGRRLIQPRNTMSDMQCCGKRSS